MRRATYWRWWRLGTTTHLTIVSYGLVFTTSRAAFGNTWNLTRNLSKEGGETLFQRATPKMVVRRIRGMVGEMLAKQFAGVDR